MNSQGQATASAVRSIFNVRIHPGNPAQPPSFFQLQKHANMQRVGSYLTVMTNSLLCVSEFKRISTLVLRF